MRQSKHGQSPGSEGSTTDDTAGGHAAPAVLPKLEGAIVGRLTGFSDAGEPLVQFEGNRGRPPVPARSTVPLGPETAVGREVVLVFEGGDPSRPIALGVLEPLTPAASAQPAASPFKLDADGERLEIQANREIVLQVGKASITLTRAGKILLRGAYLLSRSSGVNRIKGGSVQIN